MPPFIVDVVRLLAWLLVLMVVFVPLERLWARRPQRIFRKSLAADLCYFFLNSLLPKVLLIIPLSAAAWMVHWLMPGKLYDWLAETPMGIRLVAAIVVGDFGSYWGHRWSHQMPVLWRFHAIHHGAEEMDWLVNTRAHPIDLVFTRFCGLAPIYMLGLAQPVAAAMDVVPLLYAVVGTTWSFFIHANLRWRFGQLERFVSTPAFHHWHHARDGTPSGHRNYAAIFPWVDGMFGTLHQPGPEWPDRYGVDAPVARSLLGQLVQPFMPSKGSSAAGNGSAAKGTTMGR